MTEFKRGALKIIGAGLLSAAILYGAYYAAEPLGNAVLNSKAYNEWITEKAGESAKQWFDTYFPNSR